MAAKTTNPKSNGKFVDKPAGKTTAVKSANGSALNGSYKPKDSSEVSESDLLTLRASRRTYRNRHKRFD